MFVITVIAFLCVQMLLGNTYDLSTILLSMIGVKKVGNSNWYVFAIMFMWLFTYISFSQKKANPFIVLGILIVVYMVVFSQFFVKDPVMYNTVIAYLFGMLYAKYETQILSRFRNKGVYFTIVILGLAAFACVPFHNGHFILFELCVTALCGLLIAFSMRFRMESPVFDYLNTYAFEIYLVQRIPMILLAGRVSSNLLFFVISAFITIPLAILWKKLK